VVAPLLGIQFGQQKRQFDVLVGGDDGNQIERLEDVADMLVPQWSSLFLAQLPHSGMVGQ
jgi:hypothetical protein